MGILWSWVMGEEVGSAWLGEHGFVLVWVFVLQGLCMIDDGGFGGWCEVNGMLELR